MAVIVHTGRHDGCSHAENRSGLHTMAQRLVGLAWSVLVALSSLVGCAPIPVTTPVILEDAAAIKPEAAKPRKPAVKEMAEEAAVDAVGPLIVIIGSDSPLHNDVASALVKRSTGPVQIVHAGADDARTALVDLYRQNPRDVIAIGDAAAIAARNASINAIALLTTTESAARQVTSQPVPGVQFETWIAHFPEAHRIGVITGQQFASAAEALLADAEAAGITVLHSTVSNDREAWFEFRRMIPQIDGFFLLPDPTVLSPDLLRDMLAHGHRNGVRFLGYNGFLHELGVDLVISPDADAIAEAAFRLVAVKGAAVVSPAGFEVSTPVSRQRIASSE